MSARIDFADYFDPDQVDSIIYSDVVFEEKDYQGRHYSNDEYSLDN